MEEKKEGNVNTALFTAGTVLLVVGLKRALMLFEHWRWWVFLVLNLLLLAIFFTSMNSSLSKDSESKKNEGDMKMERKKKKRRQSRGFSNESETCYEDFNSVMKRSQEKEHSEEEKEENIEDCLEAENFSKEELNERVEAFIASFRQHLFFDSRRGREPKQDNGLNFRKAPNTDVILATQGGKCFVFQS